MVWGCALVCHLVDEPFNTLDEIALCTFVDGVLTFVYKDSQPLVRG